MCQNACLSILGIIKIIPCGNPGNLRLNSFSQEIEDNLVEYRRIFHIRGVPGVRNDLGPGAKMPMNELVAAQPYEWWVGPTVGEPPSSQIFPLGDNLMPQLSGDADWLKDAVAGDAFY